MLCNHSMQELLLQRWATFVFPEGRLGRLYLLAVRATLHMTLTLNENWSYVYSSDQLCACVVLAYTMRYRNHIPSSRIDSRLVSACALEMQTRRHWAVLATPTIHKRKLERPWPSWPLRLLRPWCS